jgi:hypothetical protein
MYPSVKDARCGTHRSFVDNPRSFLFGVAREFYEDPQQFDVPTDSIESWEVLRRLDSEHGIPAQEFLGLFTICRDCRKVMTQYWVEDHASVCSEAARDDVN